jgi:hypothetical protein
MAKLPSERFRAIGQLTRSQRGKMRAFDIEHSNVPNAFVRFEPQDSSTRTGRAEQDRSARLLQTVALFHNGMRIIDLKAKVRLLADIVAKVFGVRASNIDSRGAVANYHQRKILARRRRR